MHSDPNRLLIQCAICNATFLSVQVFSDDKTVEGFETCDYCGHRVPLPKGLFRELKLNEPEPREQRNLQYTAAKPFFNYRKLTWPRDFRTFEICPVVHSFESNIERLLALAELPVNVAWLSRLLQRFESEAEKQKDIRAMAAKFQEWMALHRGPVRISHIETYGEGTLKALTGQVLWNGLEASLIAQLTGTWTAFESLAGDLWRAAVDHHPRISERIQGKHRFARLDSIRKAYRVAFPQEEAIGIHAAIDDKSIDALQAVRNLIVHKAGIADSIYLDKITSTPTAPQLAIGQRLPIDGPLVHMLAGDVITKSVELIKATDAWIVSL